MCQSTHSRNSRRRIKKKGDWKCIWRNYGWKLPKPKEGHRYPGTGNTEGSKQDELIETYTKTCDNKNGKIRKNSNPPSLPLGREKQRVNYKEFPHKAISWYLYSNTAGQKRVAKYIQSLEREKPAT